jgi:Holliday junction DNA helicase RuvB
MNINEMTSLCNDKYFEALISVKMHEDALVIHQKVLSVAQSLLELSKIDLKRSDEIKIKAEKIILIAKSINKSVSYFELYQKLIAEKIQDLESENDFIVSELNALEKKKQLDSKQKKNPKIEIEISHSELPQKEILKKIENKDIIEEERLSHRPLKLEDFIGQEQIKKQLKDSIAAAKIKKQPLEHILLFGPAGLGKTSLSRIVANEMNSDIVIMNGPTIKNPMDLISVIKNLKEGDILFIDEIHRMSISSAETIYTVMEDFELSYVEKDKDNTRNVTVRLPRFTLIGATTHSGLLEKPMRDRFSIQFKLNVYEKSELETIIKNSLLKFNIEIDDEACLAIANRSRGVPRICNGFVKRITDKALINDIKTLDLNFVEEYFESAGINANGLNEIDTKYLEIIYKNFNNKPVGLENLASSMGEGKNIIESQIEPYLIYLGVIQITPSGRILTQKGIDLFRESEES